MINLSPSVIAASYLIASVLFILALRGLSHPKTARRGNMMGILGMAIAIIATLSLPQIETYSRIVIAVVVGGVIGGVIAARIQMTALPQLVALFHSFVGLAAVCVALAALFQPSVFGLGQTVTDLSVATRVEMSLGAIIGAITFTGSLIAFGKLQALLKSSPFVFRNQHMLNLLIVVTLCAGTVVFCFTPSVALFLLLITLSLILGILVIIPIGGADMPVVVSMLNSYSGWAACGIGFTLANTALIITGALVGASGAILSYIMCRGMNRSIVNVILGGLGAQQAASSSSYEDHNIKQGGGADAAFLLSNANSVIIVPGYGMAVAQAQFALQELCTNLSKRGIKVRHAIHPVAGRMPGHMNVLLAEAGIPYDDIFELENINGEFVNTSVVFIIGANDITNPAARTDRTSPIYGMPILDVDKAQNILFVKRSLAPGYAGIDNALFYNDKTMMLFADAKKMCDDIVKALEDL